MEVMCRLLAERYGCWARITSNLDFPRTGSIQSRHANFRGVTGDRTDATGGSNRHSPQVLSFMRLEIAWSSLRIICCWLRISRRTDTSPTKARAMTTPTAGPTTSPMTTPANVVAVPLPSE